MAPKSAANIAKANAILERAELEAPNVQFERGSDEAYETLNTQGYGYALIGADGKTIATHLHLPEAEKLIAKEIERRSAPSDSN